MNVETNSNGDNREPERKIGFRPSIVVPWRRFLRSDDVDSALQTITRFGWLPVLFGIVLHALARGAFEYMGDPFIIMEGYRFDGWPFALAITYVDGFFIVLFSWFLYFGAVGVIAGFLSSERTMAPEIFKVGGYLTVVFVPVFIVGTVVIATVSAPESAVTAAEVNTDDVGFQSDAYSFLYDTTQMWIVQSLKALAWIVVGFLLLPMVSRLYEIDEKRSVAAVLPVTLAAVFASFLV